jgi:recombinational DNA repair protein (RecF pathway)
MAIEKQSTEAIIVKIYESGESDAVVKMYTRDFGMIFVKSMSLRNSVKLRAHILENRISNVTVVKGKEYYRLAGAREEYDKINEHKNLPTVTSIVNRYITGEQKNVRLYERLIDYTSCKDLDINMLRICATSEIMIMLGYLDSEALGLNLESYLAMSLEDYIIHIQIRKKEAVQMITQAVTASML